MADSNPAPSGPLPSESVKQSVALVGNPNTGKTSLFNRLTGLKAHTANYPGITVDIRQGDWKFVTSSGQAKTVNLVDLPGMYSFDAMSPEEQVSRDALTGDIKGRKIPDVVVMVIDATNVERSLFLSSEVLDQKLPTVAALTLFDAAKSGGIEIDVQHLSEKLGCPVVAVSARTGEGIDELADQIAVITASSLPILNENHQSCVVGCSGCQFSARFDWAAGVSQASVSSAKRQMAAPNRLDNFLTHPVSGPIAFTTLMLGVFYLIFSLAGVPMDLIDGVFGSIGDSVGDLLPETIRNRFVWVLCVVPAALLVFAAAYRLMDTKFKGKAGLFAVAVSIAISFLPAGDFRSLVVDGLIAGIGGVVIFLPQICILFFFITLLEDSGYMARAAFVMERLMRFVGLPGKAFVPMLSAHACAIPGIMSTRVIEDWRDRLVTILVLPLLTCSARLPVYAMVAALLFNESPLKAAGIFTAAYLLGIVATLGSAWALKKTILKGDAQPLVLELPAYRMPGLRNSVLTVIDRAVMFLKNAGSVILIISLVLWFLANYPKMDRSQLPTTAAQQAESLESEIATVEAANLRPKNEGYEANQMKIAELNGELDLLMQQQELAYSFAGRMGQIVEPIFNPLGFDWKINVGILSSFAAREVIVGTLAIVYGIGEDAAEDEQTLVETLRSQKRPNGSPVFDTATCLSLLVFYVLAMQCLPTQAVTKRETGSWNWAIFQLVFMTVLAWVAAFATYQAALVFS
ncbi:MAG: ferrous iron transporter B [Fuerstiella sp.]